MSRDDEKDISFAVWPTAWGPMGAVAGRRGLRRVFLPHYQPKDLLELIRWKYPTAANEERPFARFVDLSRRYFNALGVVDFSEIRCDLPGEGSFLAAVYRACRQIPYGTTISYGELARRIGRDGAARAVARAMSSNRLPLVVPCHRVIYSDGRAGGFSAEAGPRLKQRLLELESRIHRSSS